MLAKFDRMQISFVNAARADISSKPNNIGVAVPEKETFEQIFEKAKNGNEMAAVLLDDWQRNCEPRNDKDMQVVDMINRAAKRIFR